MENQMMSTNLNNVCVPNDGAPSDNNGEQPLDLSVNVSVNRANGDETVCVANPTVTSLTTETIAAAVAAADEGLAVSEANADIASVNNAMESNDEAASTSGREVGEAAGASTDTLVDVSVSTNNEELAGAAAVVASNPANTTDVVATTTPVIDCPICLQTCIHPARLPCGHIFCFLCVKGVAYKNRRCAMCRREIPTEYLEYPQLVNGIEDICSTKATEDGYQWFYEGRNGWWQYDDRTSQDIEEAFKKGEKSCTILVAGYVYIVDLLAMVQQRQNDPSRCRRVKRDLANIPKKGVAGLRIEGNVVTADTDFTRFAYDDRQELHRSRSVLDLRMPVEYSVRRLGARNNLSGNVPGEFMTTMNATDAAISIASDIIGTTLAHADEFTQHRGVSVIPFNSMLNDTVDVETHNTSNNTGSTPAHPTMVDRSLTAHVVGERQPHHTAGNRELLNAADVLLDATQWVISNTDVPTVTLFEQTLHQLHTLTMRNFIDSSDDDDDNVDEQLTNHQLLSYGAFAPVPTVSPQNNNLTNSEANGDSNTGDDNERRTSSSSSSSSSYMSRQLHF